MKGVSFTRGEKMLIIGTIVFLIVGFTYSYFSSREWNRLISNSAKTNAEVVDYGSSMGKISIKYQFNVDGNIYTIRDQANSTIMNRLPVGTIDLEIEYAIDSPDVSRIIDNRFVRD